MATQTFTLTEEHLKLMAGANIGWDDSSYEGAPGFDVKRPYGNKDVFVDIHHLLGGEKIGCGGDAVREELTPEEESRYRKLHRELEYALEIVLHTCNFVPGIYTRQAFSSSSRWCLVGVATPKGWGGIWDKPSAGGVWEDPDR